MKKIFFGLVLFSSLNSCTQEAPTTSTLQGEAPKDSIIMENAYQPLMDDLNKKKAAFNAKASEEKNQLYADGIEDVSQSGILETAKNNGDLAPNFTLKNALGEKVSLGDYLKQGPVILTWYRGGWCPYCNLTLKRLQEELPKFHAEGANLLALTPELPDSSISTAEKHELEFEVLSDLNNKVAKEYGIVFTLIPGVAEAYQSGFGLHEYNGDESNELPLAATYVIETNGEIVYTFLDEDYRNRAEPAAILEALKTLK